MGLILRKASIGVTLAATSILLALLGISPGSAMAQCNTGIDPSQSAPTPYPASESAWPGQGVTKVLDYMNQNRAGFWAERQRRQGGTVFVGDSLIGGWSTLGADFADLKPVNRGIGADTSRGLLFRFREDVLSLCPRSIVMLIGSADLSAHQKPAVTLKNISAIVEQARSVVPDAPIVLLTIPPRSDPRAPVIPEDLQGLNRGLLALADPARRIFVLDVQPLMLDADGQQNLALYVPDRLHLGPAGYQALRQALQQRRGEFGL